MTPTQNPTQQLRTDLNMAVSWTVADLRGYEDIAPDYEMLEARLAVLKRARKLAKAEAAAAHEVLEALRDLRERISDDGSVDRKFDEDELEAIDAIIARAEEGRA